MTRAEKALRKALWESREGCTCKVVVDGKAVPREDRCSTEVIRCNGRANAWRKALSDNGLKPGDEGRDERGGALSMKAEADAVTRVRAPEPPILPMLAGLRALSWELPFQSQRASLPRPVVVQKSRRDPSGIPSADELPTPQAFLDQVPAISNYARRYPRGLEARAVFLRTQGFKAAVIARGLGLGAQTVTTWYRRHRARVAARKP